MYHNKAGFTMIEAIVSLSVIVTILSVSLSYTFKTYDAYQYKQFIKQFEQDLFYLQQLAMTQNDTYYLHFERAESRYHIRIAGMGKKVIERTYPTDWEIEPNTMILPIEFSGKGNFKKPGQIKVHTKYQQFTITCPFGKGRCYDTKI